MEEVEMDVGKVKALILTLIEHDRAHRLARSGKGF